MTKKRIKGDFEHISDIISNTLEKWLNTTGEPITKIWEIWDAALGESIAQNTRPAFLKNGVLTVHGPNSVWIQQLQFSKKIMIEKINSAAGRELVSDMKFKVSA